MFLELSFVHSLLVNIFLKIRRNIVRYGICLTSIRIVNLADCDTHVKLSECIEIYLHMYIMDHLDTSMGLLLLG